MIAKSESGMEVSVCIYTANYLYASGAEWITKHSAGDAGGHHIIYSQWGCEELRSKCNA